MFVTSLTLTLMLTVSGLEAQNLCQFRNSVEQPTTSWNFVENFSTKKCWRVENLGHFSDSKLQLAECSYWKNALREQKVFIEKSQLGGHTLKVDGGLNEKFCLSIKADNLYSAECRPSSFDQNWRFKPVRGQPNQYLIQQTSSQKCLIPRTRTTGSTIKLVPCNAFETEQIWKICTSS